MAYLLLYCIVLLIINAPHNEQSIIEKFQTNLNGKNREPYFNLRPMQYHRRFAVLSISVQISHGCIELC